MDKVYFSFNDICLLIISCFFPPISVFLKKGCNTDFCINLLLTTLTYVLGVIHAFYIIFKANEDEYRRLNDQTEENSNNITNIPDNAIVVILPGTNVNTNNNTIPSNLPPPSYAESEQLAKEQKDLLYPDLPSYDATSSSSDVKKQSEAKEKN